MHFPLFAGVSLALATTLSAQGIRKGHSEMTAAERQSYIEALNDIYADAGTSASLIKDIADFHDANFDEIHSGIYGYQFLPWHRMVLWEMEDAIQRKNAGLTIPYVNQGVWESTILGDFMDIANFDWGPASDANPRSAGGYGEEIEEYFETSVFYSTSTSNFADMVNGNMHGTMHSGWGGGMGDMNGGFAPRDPIFFLAHAFVDKLWQNWEEMHGSTGAAYGSPLYLRNDLVRYDGVYTSYYLGTLPSPTSTSLIDVRTVHGIFYSDDALSIVRLNGGYSVTNAYRSTEKFLYPGRIEASEFTVPSGKSAYFNSNTQIVLKPGFTSRGSLVVRVGGYDDNFPTSFAKKAPSAKNLPPEATPGILKVTRQAFGLTVDLQVEKTGQVTVEAFDVRGRLVSLPQKLPDLATGKQSVQLQLREGQTGPLYLRVRMGDTFHRKIVPAI